VRRRLTLAENYLDLGSPERARPLIEAARELAEESGLHEVQAWLLALLVRCDLMEGHPERVPPRLEPLLAVKLADHNDHDRAAWLLGKALLELGEPHRALEAVRSRAALPAFRVRLLAVEVAAKEALSETLEGSLQSATELLADPGVATLESLELYRMLIRALQAAGQSEKAQGFARDSSQRLAHMVASLDGKPDLQQSFRKLYRDLLG
jgi:thioredoxin-like negative regulator of GroEL